MLKDIQLQVNLFNNKKLSYVDQRHLTAVVKFQLSYNQWQMDKNEKSDK